ncbi:MAG: hypothetical protein ACI9TH_003552, partial [Kiritimatiellia bacterium]
QDLTRRGWPQVSLEQQQLTDEKSPLRVLSATCSGQKKNSCK